MLSEDELKEIKYHEDTIKNYAKEVGNLEKEIELLEENISFHKSRLYDLTNKGGYLHDIR